MCRFVDALANDDRNGTPPGAGVKCLRAINKSEVGLKVIVQLYDR
jgi:hypothetical protein